MKLSEKLIKLLEAPNTPSMILLQKINGYVTGMIGPKWSKVMGPFNILNKFYKLELGVEDPDKRDSMIRGAKESDLPKFDDVTKFILKNKKILNLK